MADQRHSAEETPTSNDTQQPGGNKPKKHWWNQNPIRRLSFTRNRSISECSDSTPESPTKTTPSSGNKERERRFSVGDSIEKHAAKREYWIRQNDLPPECFLPPW